MDAETVLLFREVNFAYRTAHGAVPALDRVSLELRPGESLAVVGANGSGKSTLARLCNGLLLPDDGTVLVDDLDTGDDDATWEIRTRVALVFQNPDNQIVGTVVEEDVAFGPENLGVPRAELRERVDASLSVVGLSGFERREPHLLSGGQKQRLAIAGALAMRPTYLVLDEPTSMLDPEGRRDVLAVIEVLRSQGHGILHVTHDLAEAARADRVMVLSAGAVTFSGTPGDLLSVPGRLGDWGLSLPPIGVLAAQLRSLGYSVPPSALDSESVVMSLCDSN